MPMSPGAGGGPGNQQGTPERSDAAGLLEADAEPFEVAKVPADLDAVGGVESAAPASWAAPEAPTGEEGLAPSSGRGLPGGMPMPHGAGGPGNQQGTPERSDAAGLLEADAEPFEATAPTDLEEAGGASSAAPLNWAVESSGPAQVGPVPMPMAARGAVGDSRASARPDAANLLAESSAPFEATAVPVEPEALTPARPPDPESREAAPAGFAQSQPATGLTSAPRPVVSEAPVVPAALPVQQPSPARPVAAATPVQAGQPQREPRQGWATGSKSGQTTPVPRVPVVRVDDAREDTSAWDVGAAAFLPTAAPVPEPSAGPVPEVRTTQATAGFVSGRPRDETAAAARPVVAGAVPVPGVPVDWSTMPTCAGDPPSEPPDEGAGEGAAGEEETMTMADLLRQDESAWGPGAGASSDVLG
jgi:hypothetical protein